MKIIIIAIILILAGCGGYADEFVGLAEEDFEISEILEVLETSGVFENEENEENEENAEPDEPPIPAGPEVPLGPAMIVVVMEVEEVLGNNPWFSLTDEQLADLTALPVFVNPLLDGAIRDGAADISTEQATAVVQNLADFFGHTIHEWYIDDGLNLFIWAELGNNGETGSITFTSNNISLGVWLNDFRIFEHENGETSPLYPNNLATTHDELAAAVQYMFDYLNLADFWGADGVRLSVTYSHMIIPPFDAMRNIHAFAAPSNSAVSAANAANAIEEILSYNFRRISIAQFGDTLSIWFDLPDLAMSQPFGYFPIITEEEARAALLAGLRFSSIPEDYWPGDEYATAAAVELVYLRGQFQEFFRPYYLFYIEMPPHITGWGEFDGQTAFGYWYVPAIRREVWEYETLIVFN
ncbi:MAG: hypothetical protein FWG68_08200 [Defluviitaleaceae bacterium]|nr:hypothetical protein [Defluviitaleaceae bacterium]